MDNMQDLDNSDRKIAIDKKFDTHQKNREFKYYTFIRLYCYKQIKFENVNFEHTIFDNCIVRSVIFENCSFIGCKFINSDFKKTKFVHCKFEHSIFQMTLIDNSIMDRFHCPYSDSENLKRDFIRSLRMNYMQLGDSESVNKAIKLELIETKKHLKNMWASKTEYFNLNKYSGCFNKTKGWIKWFWFCLLDFIWGHGESIWKLLLNGLLLMIIITIIHTFLFGNKDNISNYIFNFEQTINIFLGTNSLHTYNNLYISLITLIRIIWVGMLISIIVKRFNRR